MKSKRSLFDRVWSGFTTALVTLVVLAAILLMGSRLIGFRLYSVISGSMEPTYSVGDLIFVQKTDPEDVKVGDPITFVFNESLVVATHRVVRVDTENKRFYTKGDAHDIEDSDPVHFNNLIGVPKLAIPKLGYLSDFIQSPPGMYYAIAAGVVVLLLVFLPDILFREKDGEDADG